ncbi:hypothetical protein [Intrasporangium sp.]|uniref:hypothetical protein n=1 Tax=Intrasporangium sp. TaxID=1925024 RepID=UPI00293A4B40|nr:hypothetical protein [Intrasporangium sp.]MDV3222798.1 hypothetical protein [Intrasporangium sp.]
MTQSHEAAVLNTYRYLRLATIPLLLILLIAVGLESLRGEPCALGSISAYFHTPARGAFIGGLFAVGACLIVYKGNDPLEDVLLDFSGFMALVVALVPTVVDESCGAKYPAQNLDLTAEAVRNNITTLLIATALAVGAKWWLVRRDRRRVRPADDLDLPMQPMPEGAPAHNGAVVRWARRASWICLVILGVELGLFLFWPDTFKDVSHGVAAVTMVLGVIGVMIANARGLARVEHPADEPGPRFWVNRYSVVAAVMFVLLGLTVVAHLNGIAENHLILILEIVVILNFLVFWGMQTAELWDYPTREDKAAAEGSAQGVSIIPFERFSAPDVPPRDVPGP